MNGEFKKVLIRTKFGLNETSIENPMIGFCTGCGNRFDFLKQTINLNLAELDNHSNVSWVIVDYASETPIFDNIVNLVDERHLKSKKVRVFRYETNKGFNMSHSKNLSHRLSDSMFLFNLDCDVVLKKGCVDYLVSYIRNNYLFGRCTGQGLFGAILLFSPLFYKIKGYDEHYVRWGGEDQQLWKDILCSDAYVPYMSKSFDSCYFRHINHSNNLRFSWGEKDYYYDNEKKPIFGRGDVIDCFTGEKICVR